MNKEQEEIIIFIILVFMAFASVSFIRNSSTHTYTSNTATVVECVALLKRCDKEWGESIELLKDSGRLLNEVIE